MTLPNVQTPPASLTVADARPADNPPCARCHGTGSTYRSAADIDGDWCPACAGTTRMSNREAWRHWLDDAIAAGDHSRAYDMVDALIGAGETAVAA